MKTLFLRPLRLVFALLIGHGAMAQAPKLSVAGPWSGVIAVPDSPVPVVITLTEASTGLLSGTLDVPTQKLAGFAFTQVVMRPDSLIITSDLLGTRYAGRLSPDGQQLLGSWKQAGGQWSLNLRRGLSVAAAPKRPQEPKPPFPYREEEVSFTNPSTQHKLAGTLTLPAGKGPFPAVVLVTGSGPQDRDESIQGHHPFRVLADYLARRGVAVLRYDDRGVGKSEGTYATATTADLLTDAQAAMAFLRSRPGIVPKRVGMLGHSEGGTIALLAGAQAQPPAFIISLAGMSVSGTALLVRQQGDLLRAAGADTATLGRMRRTQQAVFAAISATTDNPVVVPRVVSLLKQANPGATDAALLPLANQMTGPWYRYFLGLDPQPALAKVRVPVLALNGSKDTQVAADLNLPAIEQGLKAAGNRDVTVQQLEGLNHLFQTATTGLPSEYGQLEETMSPAVLQIIGNWLATHTKR